MPVSALSATRRSRDRRRVRRPSVTLVTALALLLLALPSRAGAEGPGEFVRHPFALVPTSGARASIVRFGADTLRASVFPAARSFTGRFDGDWVPDVFLYNPGHARDGILDVGDGDDLTLRSEFVGGDYEPVVGDFAPPRLVDDIIWYGRRTTSGPSSATAPIRRCRCASTATTDRPSARSPRRTA